MSILPSALVACGLLSLSLVGGRAETFFPNSPGKCPHAAVDVADVFSIDVSGADRIREKKNLAPPQELNVSMPPSGGVILRDIFSNQ